MGGVHTLIYPEPNSMRRELKIGFFAYCNSQELITPCDSHKFRQFIWTNSHSNTVRYGRNNTFHRKFVLTTKHPLCTEGHWETFKTPNLILR